MAKFKATYVEVVTYEKVFEAEDRQEADRIASQTLLHESPCGDSGWENVATEFDSIEVEAVVGAGLDVAQPETERLNSFAATGMTQQEVGEIKRRVELGQRSWTTSTVVELLAETERCWAERGAAQAKVRELESRIGFFESYMGVDDD